MAKPAGYKQGYSASTVSNHALRTVDTDAAFVLPYIKPTDRILDVGCGPGSITVGFARYATHGSVIGIDLSDAVLDMARAAAVGSPGDDGVTSSAGGSGGCDSTGRSRKPGGAISFVKADAVAGLPFPDAEFDVVYASQLFPHLQHETSSRALREMRRVLKPGGLLATRDAAEVHWYPASLGLDCIMTQRMLRGIGSENWPGGGMPALLREAGFDIDADGTGQGAVGKKSSIGLGSTVHFGDEARARFADGFLGRLREGDQYRKSWTEAGITDSEIDEARAALTEWKATADAWYLGTHTEILAWK
jgi:SAM-dependent methyltransferase